MHNWWENFQTMISTTQSWIVGLQVNCRRWEPNLSHQPKLTSHPLDSAWREDKKKKFINPLAPPKEGRLDLQILEKGSARLKATLEVNLRSLKVKPHDVDHTTFAATLLLMSPFAASCCWDHWWKEATKLCPLLHHHATHKKLLLCERFHFKYSRLVTQWYA